MTKYPWESDFLNYLTDAEWRDPPEHLEVVAMAVINTETGEAALIEVMDSGETGVIQADYRKDILGDAEARYVETLEERAAMYRRVN